jgi:hypothetical protein
LQNQLFRKVSLERLSSPEQLDQLMTITNPRGWIALVGVFCLLTVLVLWGFFGLITSKIDASGVVIGNSPAGAPQVVIYVPFAQSRLIAPGMHRYVQDGIIQSVVGGGLGDGGPAYDALVDPRVISDFSVELTTLPADDSQYERRGISFVAGGQAVGQLALEVLKADSSVAKVVLSGKGNPVEITPESSSLTHIILGQNGNDITLYTWDPATNRTASISIDPTTGGGPDTQGGTISTQGTFFLSQTARRTSQLVCVAVRGAQRPDERPCECRPKFCRQSETTHYWFDRTG